MNLRTHTILGALPLLLLGGGSAVAGDSSLTDLSLEELMNEPVTSVSKKETRLGDSAAAIAVVTQEDIRRLGITSLPEALRLVPGMDVARISANEWAVSARGFNNEFANKLLVLIDGRTVYTPSSAGVFWNEQDVVLEDLDRIEVIRGPGATLWGANAVNGVINIITKHSAETTDGLLAAAGGTEEEPLLTARYGAARGDVSFRVFGKYFSRDGLVDSTGEDAAGAWHTAHGGFRLDWAASGADAVTLEGDAYEAKAGKNISITSLTPVGMQAVDEQSHSRGSNVVGRWTHTYSKTSELSLQAFVDQVDQGDRVGAEQRFTYDLDLQHRFALGTRNDVVWGLGYRFADIDTASTFTLAWTPTHQVRWSNVFVQDELTVVPERLRLTFGAKLEHDNLTGSSVQPNVRALWTPDAHQSLWAAASRATRTPSLFELRGRLNAAAFETGPGNPPVLVAVAGNPDADAEKLTAYEVGYRIVPDSRVSIDVAAFVNRYEDLLAFVADAPQFELTPGPPHVLMLSTAQNAVTAQTHGVELSAQWQVVPGWKLAGSYTWLHMDVRPDSGTEGESPRHQFQVRSYLDLPARAELNGALYYVDSITPQSGLGRVHVPAYVRLDVGLTWRPRESWLVGIWGQNLVDDRHLESGSSTTPSLTEVPRGVVAKVSRGF